MLRRRWLFGLAWLLGALGGSAGLQAGERLFPELQSLAELADPQLLAARALAALREGIEKGTVTGLTPPPPLRD